MPAIEAIKPDQEAAIGKGMLPLSFLFDRPSRLLLYPPRSKRVKNFVERDRRVRRKRRTAGGRL